MQEAPKASVIAQDKVGALVEKSVNTTKQATRQRVGKEAVASQAKVFENPSEVSFPPPSLCNVNYEGQCVQTIHAIWEFSSPILWFLNLSRLFYIAGFAYMSINACTN